MEAANWLLGVVLNKLSDDLVKAYVSSTELGLNLKKIEDEMLSTRVLLEAAERGDVVASNSGLQGQLEKLRKKADEVEDALDELHYFMIQDKLDGTRYATPELGDGLSAKAQHARHAARNTSGNWLSCFSACCRSQDADVAAAAASDAHNTHSTSSAISADHGGHVGKLSFDRVAMSNTIKQLIEELHNYCDRTSKSLKVVLAANPQSHMPASTKRSDTSSTITQKLLYGRDDIFKKTVNEIISVAQSGTTLSVLPIVGPGGIGKTTFTQHLVHDSRIKECFPDTSVWICVSTNFDVLKLTKEIWSCLPPTENDGSSNISNETTNLDLIQKSIAKRLKSKRFLIVLDDIWKCSSRDEWGKLLAPFEKGDTSGNMVLVTTRFPKIVEMVTKETNPIDLRGLAPDEFWKFFQMCAFGRIQDDHDDQELIGIAKQIAGKLKCSPLAAKTVGRLLNQNPSQEHWMEILEKKEWLKQEHDDDIIPALKISYYYLPFYLKKCFSSFGLFPEDHKFDRLEIISFWDSIGIIDSSRQNKRIEDIGSNYLDELVDNGFLMKGDDNYFVMHDLLHDLSRSVSVEECAYINCSSFKANDIPQSVCYLSIFMHDTHTKNFEEEMGKLKEKIDIKNLRSLMIFGEYSRLPLVNVLTETFNEIKCLRVLSIFMYSHNSLPRHFPKLVHLRYLKLRWPSYSNVCLPSTVPRFYHLKFLDINQWVNNYTLPKDISRLENLRHFVAKKELHANVPEVGKMRFLQELKEFYVKKESVGFELGELGKLEELRGVLYISGLENVRTSQEAKEAKLMAKRDLVMLGLVWNIKQESTGDDILDSLQPHSNIRELRIVKHGGVISPSWLCGNILHMKNLEALHLEGMSWSKFPPIGQMYHLRTLKLKNIAGISHIGPDFFGGTTEKSFTRLKEIEFDDMPELVEWVGGADCHMFSRLEKIRCTNCPKLTKLLISGLPISSTQDNTIWFPSLCELKILNCPELCLPPLPHTSVLSRIETDCFNYNRTALYISKPCELAFYNLRGIESLAIRDASVLSYMDLQKLHSLNSIRVQRCGDTFLRGLDVGVVLHKVQSLSLSQFPVTRKSLSNLFKCFPALSRLQVLASSDEAHEEVILQFPPSTWLRQVSFDGYKNLILPVKEEEGAGFCGLSSLESVTIDDCEKLFSRWSIGEAGAQTRSTINPLPSCLKKLQVWNSKSMMVPVALFSNLTSLTSLVLINCKDSIADGFDPRMACNLEHLLVYNQRDDEAEPYSIAADLLAAVARAKPMPAGSFQLASLDVDSISAVLVAPICSRLSATLRRLSFCSDWRTENFTEEQDDALQLLTSLQTLWFDNCMALQSLPQGLHRLPSLQELHIDGSRKIRSLPKEGFPDSLRNLYIYGCCAEIYEECQKLRGTRPDIYVRAFTAREQV